MAKTKEIDGQEAPQNEVKITPEIAKSIEDLIFQQKNMMFYNNRYHIELYLFQYHFQNKYDI